MTTLQTPAVAIRQIILGGSAQGGDPVEHFESPLVGGRPVWRRGGTLPDPASPSGNEKGGSDSFGVSILTVPRL